MNRLFNSLIICACLIFPALFYSCSEEEPLPSGPELTLWYDEPADDWNEALPIGNGSLGAMVFGRTDQERIQLNEESIWTRQGAYEDRDGSKALPAIRQLLFDGRYGEAEDLLVNELMQERLPTGTNAYQTLGDLSIEYNDTTEVTDYRRALLLDSALVRVDYKRNGIDYQRNIFASTQNKVIVYREKAGKGGEDRCFHFDVQARRGRNGHIQG